MAAATVPTWLVRFAAMPFVKGRAVLSTGLLDGNRTLAQPMAVCRDNKPRCASDPHLASTKSVAPVGLERSESPRRVLG